MAESEKSNNLVIELSLLREITHAISDLSPDRALLFIVESAVSVTTSRGAIFMKPHEKLSEMVPLVENLPFETDKASWHNGFLSKCFRLFLVGSLVICEPASTQHQNLELPDAVGQALVIPIKLAGKPVALLFIFRGSCDEPYNDNDKSFLDILSPFLGTLLENYRLQNEVIHKTSRLSALYEISQRAESLIDFRDVYVALYQVVKSFIHFDAYLLYLLDAKSGILEIRDAMTQSSFPSKVPLNEGPIGTAAAQRRPHLTYTSDFKSVLILPIIVSGDLVGVLTIASRKSYAYRDEDIIGLRIISTQIASIDQIFKDLLRLRGVTQHILESMTSGVLIFDNNSHVTFSNPEMTRILARPVPEQWSPESPEEVFPEALKNVILDVLESNLTVENERIALDQLVPPRIIELNAFPFRDEQGETQGNAMFIKDITQINRLEDQLKRADRLSALGVLAAGIAHEIRNPLTGMKMIVQLLAADISDEDPRREPIGIIQKEIDRLEKIIVNLLDFARPSKPKIEQLELYDVINTCLMLVQNQMNKLGVSLTKEFPEEQPALIGDPNQLKQVFLNILTNAIHAMNVGGKLGIQVEEHGNWVTIAFKDNGCGMPKSRLKAIFDPFMTTKEDGTGLGLSMALRIVEEHGGRIEVESFEGQGSTFSVVLPNSGSTKFSHSDDNANA